MTADARWATFRSELENIPEEEVLSRFQRARDRIRSPSERELFSSYFEHALGADSVQIGADSVVVVVHGIQSHASWYRMVTEALRRNDAVDVVEIRYGWLPFFMLVPYLRRFPMAEVESNLKSIRLEYPRAKISVIAHSFGTYLVASVLESNASLRVDSFVLCGSVVDQRFRWHEKANKPDLLVNDCGLHDYLPAAAKALAWLGAAGTFGFNSYVVKNRFFRFGHGGFFSRPFIEQYWLPALLHGQVVPDPDGVQGSWPRTLAAIVSGIPGLVTVLTAFFVSAYCLT